MASVVSFSADASVSSPQTVSSTQVALQPLSKGFGIPFDAFNAGVAMKLTQYLSHYSDNPITFLVKLLYQGVEIFSGSVPALAGQNKGDKIEMLIQSKGRSQGGLILTVSVAASLDFQAEVIAKHLTNDGGAPVSNETMDNMRLQIGVTSGEGQIIWRDTLWLQVFPDNEIVE